MVSMNTIRPCLALLAFPHGICSLQKAHFSTCSLLMFVRGCQYSQGLCSDGPSPNLFVDDYISPQGVADTLKMQTGTQPVQPNAQSQHLHSSVACSHEWLMGSRPAILQWGAFLPPSSTEQILYIHPHAGLRLALTCFLHPSLEFLQECRERLLMLYDPLLA